MTTRFSPGHHGLEPGFSEIQLTAGPGYPEDVAEAYSKKPGARVPLSEMLDGVRRILDDASRQPSP